MSNGKYYIYTIVILKDNAKLYFPTITHQEFLFPHTPIQCAANFMMFSVDEN